MLEQRLSAWSAYVLGALRIMSGLLFLEHGTAKLLKFPHDPQLDGIELMSLMGAAGILELVGGALIVIGFLTRPVAFILSGMMAVAYFMVHAPMGLFPLLNMGEAAILYCFIFLYLSAAGAGAFSVDNRA